MINFSIETGKFTFTHEGKTYKSPNGTYIARQYELITGKKPVMAGQGPEQEGSGYAAEASSQETVEAKEEISIDARFRILARNIKMVVNGLQNSLIITGEGGIGKSHTVKKTLEECGLSPAMETAGEYEYARIGGFSTAKGLYTDLYNNRDKVIVFDDCDNVLKDPISIDILKNALDSNDDRVISWKADMKTDDVPRSFRFTGRVIFISNMDREKFSQALISRSNCIDLKMTLEQKLDRMEDMILNPEFLPSFHLDDKIKALDTIRQHKDTANEISLRTLIKVTKIAAMFTGDEFEETAEYTLTN